MLVLSYNARGIRGGSKLIALKRMIKLIKPKIVLLQETIMEGEKVMEVMSFFFKDWRMEEIHLEGHLGGLITS